MPARIANRYKIYSRAQSEIDGALAGDQPAAYDGQSTSQCNAVVLRESRSLDPFPMDFLNNPRKAEPTQLIPWKLMQRKTSLRSLGSCDKCLVPRRNSKTSLASEKLLNNNYPNGNVIIVPAQRPAEELQHRHNPQPLPIAGQPIHINDTCNEEAETPLLRAENCLTSSSDDLSKPVKRWRSLDEVPAPDNGGGVGGGCVAVPGLVDKKGSARNSLRGWLTNIFHGNGIRSSNSSVRRGVIPGYDIQSERESIV